MQTLKLKDGVIFTGVMDHDIRVFDIIMETKYGTTYNAYVIKGSEKTALVETVKDKFFDEYKAELAQTVDMRDVDYIILSHTEPDHTGALERIIEMNPQVTLVGTASAMNFIAQILNREFNSMTVKDGDTLDLGGKTLTFMPLPYLHWPDTMFTYLAQDTLLFTCDAFGCHYAHDGILSSTVTDHEAFLEAQKYYFDNIIGPYKNPFMDNALKRIEGLEIDMICTGHGPVIDVDVPAHIARQREWTKPTPANTKKLVVMPYVSAYGYTRALAEKIAEGIRASGDIEVALYDLVDVPADKVLPEIARADGLLLGTPTMVGEALKPIWDLTTSMFPHLNAKKPASAFGSYGWSGEGVPHIIERLKQLRMDVVDGYRVRFKPDAAQLKGAYDFGYAFGCKVLDKENDRG